MSDTNPSPSAASPSTAERCAIAGALVLLTLVAAGLRVWRLGSVPAGLHFDEAANGLLIQDHIFRGETPVFFSAYAGREALFQYTQAPFLALLGPTVLALRLPAALWSSALVPIVYLPARGAAVGLATRPDGGAGGCLQGMAGTCRPDRVSGKRLAGGIRPGDVLLTRRADAPAAA